MYANTCSCRRVGAGCAPEDTTEISHTYSAVITNSRGVLNKNLLFIKESSDGTNALYNAKESKEGKALEKKHPGSWQTPHRLAFTTDMLNALGLKHSGGKLLDSTCNHLFEAVFKKYCTANGYKYNSVNHEKQASFKTYKRFLL